MVPGGGYTCRLIGRTFWSKLTGALREQQLQVRRIDERSVQLQTGGKP
jgi:hypothetical protein